jgi:ABC-2 type transport system permease protein
MFFSTALVPSNFMPDWIKYISTINPINYAVEAVRDVLVGTPIFSAYGTATLILTLFTVAALWWAVAAFNDLRD